MIVVARGVERGLEQAVRFMVPALLLLMLVLLGYAITSGSFAVGVAFMFTPDFEALTWDGVLQAMGQAFFTLSLGMGAVMAYGAYLPKETSITGASVSVVAADTLDCPTGRTRDFSPRICKQSRSGRRTRSGICHFATRIRANGGRSFFRFRVFHRIEHCGLDVSAWPG